MISCCAQVTAVRGLALVDELLGALGHPIRKAAGNPNTPTGFDDIVAEVSVGLSEATAALEERALERMLQKLDVDWPTLTAAEREVVIAAAVAIAPKPSVLARAAATVFDVSVASIIEGSRGNANLPTFHGTLGRFDLGKDPVVQFLKGSQALYITDHLKRRNEALDARVRAIVARGLQDGLTRADIGADLVDGVGPARVLGRQAHYWDAVASIFTGKARSYGLLSAYAEAGIQHFLFEAVLDEVTTDQCRFFHGQVFSVGGGLDLYHRMAASPEAAREIAPFVRVGRNAEGEKVLYTRDLSGQRHEIVRVLRSGVGTVGDVGEYSTALTADQMMTMGLPVPPLHGFCRSSLVSA